MRSPPSRRRRRYIRILLAAVGVLFLGFVAETLAFFVYPATGQVRQPQAVVMLDGYGNRLARAEMLARHDHVANLAVSDPPYGTCPAATAQLHVYCFHPTPVSTLGEARAVASLARQHHWTRLLVVAGTTQIERARLRLERCVTVQMAFSGVDPGGFFQWLGQIAYGEAAMVKALIWQTSC